ncbi:MAG: phosphatase PAP2 family protein, partial [Patescibacteria group bacterium]|nr:phosphatase PAP2 family protein [Patescibacteria group bacterium]
VSGIVEPFINTAHLAGSFPSDHAAIAWSLACAYALLPNTKNAWLFFCLAFLVSIGRVAAGVHFASDAAFGAVVGVIAAWVVSRIARHPGARAIFSR